MSRKSGTEGSGWFHLKGEHSMAVSEVSWRKALVGTGWTFCAI